MMRRRRKAEMKGDGVFYTHSKQPTTKGILVISRITFHDQEMLITQLESKADSVKVSIHE